MLWNGDHYAKKKGNENLQANVSSTDDDIDENNWRMWSILTARVA